MQIWKLLYMFVFIHKQYRESSQELSGYLPVKFVIFLKIALILNIFYCF